MSETHQTLKPTTLTGRRRTVAQKDLDEPNPGRRRVFRKTWEVAPPPPVGIVMFYVVFDRIAPAGNKYMATLFNTSTTRKVVIHRIWAENWQVAAVVGVSLDEYIARITARTVGTAVTIRAEDTNDTPSAGISADTDSTGVTETNIFKRFLAVSEEGSALGTQLGEDFKAQNRNFQLVYERHPSMKGHTLRQNQGVSIRNVTVSTVGTVSYIIEFTDEAA